MLAWPSPPGRLERCPALPAWRLPGSKKKTGGAAGQPRPTRHSTHVLFLYGALLAVEGVRDAKAAADDAPPSVRPVVALVAHPHQRGGPHVAVALHALAVACSTGEGQGSRARAGEYAAPGGRRRTGRQRARASHFSQSLPIAARATQGATELVTGPDKSRGRSMGGAQAGQAGHDAGLLTDAWLLPAHNQVRVVLGHARSPRSGRSPSGAATRCGESTGGGSRGRSRVIPGTGLLTNEMQQQQVVQEAGSQP